MEDSNNGHAHEKAVVYQPSGAPEEKIEAAMDNCPSACIYWV
jgi:ferredoxin